MSDYEISGAYLKAKVESIEQSLKENNKKNDAILSKISKMESRITRLEVKSGIWGAIGGTLVILVQIIIKKVT